MRYIESVHGVGQGGRAGGGDAKDVEFKRLQCHQLRNVG